jgi:hypothetical protein
MLPADGRKEMATSEQTVPPCVQVLGATPELWEVVSPDPNAHLNGIKWQTGAGFQQGFFGVALQGPLAVGITHVAAKGPDVGYGTIVGPVCGLVGQLSRVLTE